MNDKQFICLAVSVMEKGLTFLNSASKHTDGRISAFPLMTIPVKRCR